jgi:hypothetical protein
MIREKAKARKQFVEQQTKRDNDARIQALR